MSPGCANLPNAPECNRHRHARQATHLATISPGNTTTQHQTTRIQSAAHPLYSLVLHSSRPYTRGMSLTFRPSRRFAFLLPLLVLAAPPAPAKPVKEPVPWLYRGSDVPPDKEWVFGELPNNSGDTIPISVLATGATNPNPRHFSLASKRQTGNLLIHAQGLQLERLPLSLLLRRGRSA